MPVLARELARELVLEPALVLAPEREREPALVPEQALEPVRVLGQGLVPHMQPPGSQLPPVLV